jgi:hypothetical protein
MAPDLAVYVPKINQPEVFTRDLDECRGYALDPKAKTGLDAGKLTEKGLEGGASNASGAALKLLVPALGALGGLTTEMLSELGISTGRPKAIFVKCLDILTRDDHSALVLEPNPMVQ